MRRHLSRKFDKNTLKDGEQLEISLHSTSFPTMKPAAKKKASKSKKRKTQNLAPQTTVSDGETFKSVSDTSTVNTEDASSAILDAVQTSKNPVAASLPPAADQALTPLSSLPSAPTGRTNRAHDIEYFFNRGSKLNNTLTKCKSCR